MPISNNSRMLAEGRRRKILELVEQSGQSTIRASCRPTSATKRNYYSGFWDHHGGNRQEPQALESKVYGRYECPQHRERARGCSRNLPDYARGAAANGLLFIRRPPSRGH